MKTTVLCIAALAGSQLASGQSGGVPSSGSFLGLTTPMVLPVGSVYAGINYRGFGGEDKLSYLNFSGGYGISPGAELEYLGDFARNATFTNAVGTIRYGGWDSEVRLRYRVVAPFPIAVQFGVAYVNSPAQENRVATTYGASLGYHLDAYTRVYAEPKAVLLYKNSLLGVAFGLTREVIPGVTAMATWTPLLAGHNTISTQSLNRTQVQLYGLGLRFTQLIKGLTVDVAYTNTLGNSTGSSLTPSLGSGGGLSVEVSHRF